MATTITIRLGPDAVRVIETRHSITIRKKAAGRQKYGEPREGGYTARILAWAAEDGARFTTADVTETFPITRPHASVLLGKLANGPYPLRRVKRGVYQYRV